MTVGAFILGCAGPRLSAAESDFFRDADPLGFILFARNVETPDQMRALTADLRDCLGRAAPVLIDQEGGRVQRMGPPWWRKWLPPLDQMAHAGPADAARSMYLRYRLIAEELRSVGIDVNCAPVADIAGETTHPFLLNRCYGTETSVVVGAARAVAQGLMEGGVQPVIKHLPGHGRATADSHAELPRVTASLDALEAADFAAFRLLADLPMAMTAHIVFDAIDPDRPATLSPDAIALIRDRIGFAGLLMTDDISMGALAGSVGDRASASIAAGCDVVLHCNGDMGEMREVAAMGGALSPAAASRAAGAVRSGVSAPADVAALAAELEALVPGAAVQDV